MSSYDTKLKPKTYSRKLLRTLDGLISNIIGYQDMKDTIENINLHGLNMALYI
jgi:hypothetical protein